jgi:hypothetical protein
MGQIGAFDVYLNAIKAEFGRSLDKIKDVHPAVGKS